MVQNYDFKSSFAAGIPNGQTGQTGQGPYVVPGQEQYLAQLAQSSAGQGGASTPTAVQMPNGQVPLALPYIQAIQPGSGIPVAYGNPFVAAMMQQQQQQNGPNSQVPGQPPQTPTGSATPTPTTPNGRRSPPSAGNGQPANQPTVSQVLVFPKGCSRLLSISRTAWQRMFVVTFFL